MEREDEKNIKQDVVDTRPELENQIRFVTRKHNESTKPPKPKMYASSTDGRVASNHPKSMFELKRIEYARDFANELRFKKVYHPNTVQLIEDAMIEKNVNLTDYLLSSDKSEEYYYTAYLVYYLYREELFTDEELKSVGKKYFRNPVEAKKYLNWLIEQKEGSF